MRLHAHQLSQHLGPRDHGNRSAARLDDFRVVIAHRGRTHDDVSVADILGRMTFGNFNAEFFEMGRHIRLFLIRTRHAKTKIRQHLGDARHAYAADTDEVNVLETPKHTNQ